MGPAESAGQRGQARRHIRVGDESLSDPKLVLAEDASHSEEEPRYLAFGRVAAGVLTVRFTLRGKRVRIIGADYWRKGKTYYEEANRLQQ